MHLPSRLSALLLALSLSLGIVFSAAAQDAGSLTINSPQTGQTLQGTVSIEGNSAVDGFLSAQLQFAYADDPTGTWFLIQETDQPVQDGTLATWDTTTLTDGVYSLRLRVRLADGTSFETQVDDLRIVNTVPTETPVAVAPTSAPTALPTQPKPAPTSTGTPYPTPTPLNANPVAVQPGMVYASLQNGALVILGLFVLFGLILGIRSRKRK
jgi:hypothetical protein